MKKSFYLVGCTLMFMIGLSFITGGSIAHANVDVPLKGWAWSSTIGWISMTSTNPELSGVTPAGSAYGVSISLPLNSVTPPSPLTGILSGYAWSPNIGWVSFDPTDITSTNCPAGSGCTPTVNLTTGAVSGWARALAGSGTMGWDGWIELAGTNHATNGSIATRGVTFSNTTGAFGGYAWGSTNVGWASFDAVTCPGCMVSLTVNNLPSSGITVTSSPAGINCSSNAACTAQFPINTKVVLTAASSNYTIGSYWNSNGDTCEVTGTVTTNGSGTRITTIDPVCTIIMLQNDTVSPAYSAKMQLAIGKSGTGSGSVTTQLISGPATTPTLTCGTSCSTTQSGTFDVGTRLTVVPTASAGSSFIGYTATFGCGNGGSGCPVTIVNTDPTGQPYTGTQVITAQFALNSKITVTKAGSGTGTVSDATSAINCGTACSTQFAQFDYNVPVTLTAAPDAGSYFTGWTSACSGAGTTCSLYGSLVDQNVIATFDSNPTLSIAKSGSGTGTVTTIPAGISCGATCSAQFTSGSSVTLAAVPTAGSTFIGWSGGGCSGILSCNVIMDASKTVTAGFNIPPVTLTVTTSGAGIVTSNPAGISCGATCSAQFGTGATIVLSAATTSATYKFTGWGGACSASGTATTCTVVMTAAKSVTATFAQNATPIIASCSFPSPDIILPTSTSTITIYPTVPVSDYSGGNGGPYSFSPASFTVGVGSWDLIVNATDGTNNTPIQCGRVIVRNSDGGSYPSTDLNGVCTIGPGLAGAPYIYTLNSSDNGTRTFIPNMSYSNVTGTVLPPSPSSITLAPGVWTPPVTIADSTGHSKLINCNQVTVLPAAGTPAPTYVLQLLGGNTLATVGTAPVYATASDFGEVYIWLKIKNTYLQDLATYSCSSNIIGNDGSNAIPTAGRYFPSLGSLATLGLSNLKIPINIVTGGTYVISVSCTKPGGPTVSSSITTGITNGILTPF